VPCALQELKHPNIVRYLDVFEIDHDSFATVLEFCRGTDLDRRLKEEGTLLERDARAVVIQVLAALCHLNGVDGVGKKESVRDSARGLTPPCGCRLASGLVVAGQWWTVWAWA
jgi:serine/threonine protein kinase